MASPNDDDRAVDLTRIVRAGDVELQVLDRGSGMPVLLVHGFPLDHSMWDAPIARLSDRWRVIAPDLPGFGGSQATSGTVTMAQMASHLAALVDALAVEEPIVLCGLSMGGYIALEFWRRYAARLRALVLCDTRAAPDTPEGARGRRETADMLLREGTQPLADAMLPRLFAAATLESRSNVAAIERRKILAARPSGLAAALRGMAERRDFRGQLGKIELPTLVVVGEHDAISTVEEMRSLAGAIPDAEFVIIPRSGHLPPLENPDAFNKALGKFLTRVERGA
jgi:pimeloyl-ACP methyl ester carboxylesterase